MIMLNGRATGGFWGMFKLLVLVLEIRFPLSQSPKDVTWDGSLHLRKELEILIKCSRVSDMMMAP
jgi:hypothetical protein